MQHGYAAWPEPEAPSCLLTAPIAAFLPSPHVSAALCLSNPHVDMLNPLLSLNDLVDQAQWCLQSQHPEVETGGSGVQVHSGTEKTLS